MKKFVRGLGIVGIVLLLVTAISIPVLAISNPTDTSIQSIKAFQNIFEDDDILFFVRYDVNYTEEPDEPASDTFVVSLYDTDGTTLLYQRELNYYGLNIISIYLTPIQVLTLPGIGWGSEYVIKVMGNPSIFGELTEGINMATRSLSASNDYISGTMDTSRGLLGQFCIDTARVLQADEAWPTLLTTSDKLNTQGAITFNAAVPGLYTACPSIYSTAVTPPTMPTVTRTVVLKGVITGVFTAGESVTGGTTGAAGVFIVGSQTATQIQVTHSGIAMFRGEETATGGTSDATIVVGSLVVGGIEEVARGRTGTRLRNALDNFGAWLGISGNAFGGLALFLFFAITAGLVFTATGSVHGAVLVSIPVILMGNYMGLMSFAITWRLVVIVALLFAVLFIMGRFA